MPEVSRHPTEDAGPQERHAREATRLTREARESRPAGWAVSDVEGREEREEPRRRQPPGPPEQMAESFAEAEAEGRPRNAVIKRFLSEATSPDAFGLSAMGSEYADGMEWLRVQFVQTHPGDREEIMQLILYPVLRNGRLFIEAARFDRQTDPSGQLAVRWEDDIRRQNRAEIERLQADDDDTPW